LRRWFVHVHIYILQYQFMAKESSMKFPFTSWRPLLYQLYHIVPGKTLSCLDFAVDPPKWAMKTLCPNDG
jgi:hypothetical protein